MPADLALALAGVGIAVYWWGWCLVGLMARRRRSSSDYERFVAAMLRARQNHHP